MKKKVFLDGTNLLLNAKLEGRPSCYVFAAIVDLLTRKGYECHGFFDDSIRHRLREAGAPEEWEPLDRLIKQSAGRLQTMPFADRPLIETAIRKNGYVANHSDRYADLAKEFPKLPPVIRVICIAGRITLTFTHPQVQHSADLPDELELYGVRFSKPRAQNGGAPVTCVLGPTGLTKSLEARLIVFALDASGSMWNEEDDAKKTFDGRTKSEHLREILRDTMTRFGKSNIRNSLYIALMNFAGQAHVQKIAGAEAVHFEHAATYIRDQQFNYRDGADGYGTNLTEALKRATTLLDAVLSDPNAKKLATKWHALILLVTDAKDTVDPTAVLREAALIALRRGTARSGAVRIASVGLGKECNLELLREISSIPSPELLTRLQKAGLDRYLQTAKGSKSLCLSLHVDTADRKYPEVIRQFIDAASTTTD